MNELFVNPFPAAGPKPDQADFQAANDKLDALIRAEETKAGALGVTLPEFKLSDVSDFIRSNVERCARLNTLRRVMAAQSKAGQSASDEPDAGGMVSPPAQISATANGGEIGEAVSLTDACRLVTEKTKPVKKPTATVAAIDQASPVVAVSNAQKKEANEQGKTTINLTEACRRAKAGQAFTWPPKPTTLTELCLAAQKARAENKAKKK